MIGENKKSSGLCGRGQTCGVVQGGGGRARGAQLHRQPADRVHVLQLLHCPPLGKDIEVAVKKKTVTKLL